MIYGSWTAALTPVDHGRYVHVLRSPGYKLHVVALILPHNMITAIIPKCRTVDFSGDNHMFLDGGMQEKVFCVL